MTEFAEVASTRPGVRVVAVGDVSLTAAPALAGRFGGTAYAGWPVLHERVPLRTD